MDSIVVSKGDSGGDVRLPVPPRFPIHHSKAFRELHDFLRQEIGIFLDFLFRPDSVRVAFHDHDFIELKGSVDVVHDVPQLPAMVAFSVLPVRWGILVFQPNGFTQRLLVNRMSVFGARLDCVEGFAVEDIFKTSVCPLARVMRRELKKRGVTKLKVVYSKEEPLAPVFKNEEAIDKRRRSTPGSISYVPGAAGLILAGEVIKDIAFNSH